MSSKDLFDLNEYLKCLEALPVQSNEDQKILEECRQYLSKLEEMDLILRRLSSF